MVVRAVSEHIEEGDRLAHVQKETERYARGLSLTDLNLEARLAQVRAKTYEVVMAEKLVLHVRNLSAQLCAKFGTDCLINFDPSIHVVKILNDGVMVKLLVYKENYDAVIKWLTDCGYDCTDARPEPGIIEKFKAFYIGISFAKMEEL